MEYGLEKVILTEVKPEPQKIKIPVINGEDLEVEIGSEIFSSLGEENFGFQIKFPRSDIVKKANASPSIRGGGIFDACEKLTERSTKQTKTLHVENFRAFSSLCQPLTSS